MKNRIFEMSVALLIPTSSKYKSWEKFSDSFLSLFFLKSFKTELPVKIFLGVDQDDPFYTKSEVLEDMKTQIKFDFHITRYQNVEKGHLTKMWNILFDTAYRDENINYFFQCGDDIFFQDDWLTKGVEKLRENNDIGIVGPIDLNNTKLLTNVLVSRKHMEIFGYFFPEEIRNWYCDDWINNVYALRGRLYRVEGYYIENKGGKERYTPNELDYFEYVERDMNKIPFNVTNTMTVVTETDSDEKMKTLSEIPLYKIVFVRNEVENFKKYENEITKVFLYTSWLEPYLYSIENKYNLDKTDMCRIASELNPFHSEVFGWCDYDLIYNSKRSELLSALSFNKNVSKTRITVTGFWPISLLAKNFCIYQNENLFFSSKIFFGFKQIIRKFDFNFKREVFKGLSKNRMTYDVNYFLEIFRISPETFYLFQSQNYDCVFRNFSKLKPREKLGIVVSCYNRPDYLEKTLTSFKNSFTRKLPFSVEVIFIDDASTETRTKKMLEDFSLNFEDVTVIKSFKPENTGVHNSLKHGWNFLISRGCDLLMNLDSDVIVSKNFLEKIMKKKDDVKDFDVLTGYNSASHETVATLNGYVEKKSIGGINMLFTPEFFRDKVNDCLIDNFFDWAICRIAKKLVSMSPSVIQHIGVQGMNNAGKNFDKADDFEED